VVEAFLSVASLGVLEPTLINPGRREAPANAPLRNTARRKAYGVGRIASLS